MDFLGIQYLRLDRSLSVADMSSKLSFPSGTAAYGSPSSSSLDEDDDEDDEDDDEVGRCK